MNLPNFTLEKNVGQFSGSKVWGHRGVIERLLYDNPPIPVVCEMDMTNRCNHKCPGCCGWIGDKSAEKTLDEAKDQLDKIAKFEFKSVIFTGGGEPLMNKATTDAMCYAHSLGLDVALITNGSRLSKYVLEKVLPFTTWIRVSLDAGDPRMFNYTHGVGVSEFYRVSLNCRRAVRMRNASNSKCAIGVGYLTGVETIEWMEIAAVYARSLGVDYIQYRPYTFYEGRGEDRSVHDMSRFWTILGASLDSETDDFKVMCSLDKYLLLGSANHRQYDTCYCAMITSLVSANGDVYLCCNFRGLSQYVLGNLNKQSFSQIWNGPKRRAVLRGLDVSKCPPLCRGNSMNNELAKLFKTYVHPNFF